MSDPGTKPKRLRKNLLNITLAGMPELAHFATAKERDAALAEIASEAGNPTKGGFWLAIAVIVTTVVAARFVAGWLLSFVSWPNPLEDLLKIASILVAFFLVLRWLHRSGASGDLRKKLLARGVPVCTGCGYLLRGLSPETGRCPECGREFDLQVRTILGAQ